MGLYHSIKATAFSNQWEVQYDLVHENEHEGRHALALTKNWNPISIREHEWNTIRDFVKRHRLSRGYELATGVGLSCTAAGLGMKDNLSEMKAAPRLVTMDAYIEENRSGSLDYAHDAPQCYVDADGYKSVQQLIRHFELEDIVFPKVGWSPDDTVARLSEVFDLKNEKLDFVFIDGQHYLEFVLADLKVVLPYLQRERFALFLHDTHAPGFSPKLEEFLIENFGKSYTVCPGCAHYENGFNLSVITDLPWE